MTLMESSTHIDFLTGSIAQYPGPILCYRLKRDPLAEDLHQYLKACEIFTGNHSRMNQAFGIVIDARAFCATEENALDELADFYAGQQRAAIIAPALVIPADARVRMALDTRLRERWNVSDKRFWYDTFDEAFHTVHRLLAADRRTTL